MQRFSVLLLICIGLLLGGCSMRVALSSGTIVQDGTPAAYVVPERDYGSYPIYNSSAYYGAAEHFWIKKPGGYNPYYPYYYYQPLRQLKK